MSYHGSSAAEAKHDVPRLLPHAASACSYDRKLRTHVAGPVPSPPHSGGDGVGVGGDGGGGSGETEGGGGGGGVEQLSV